MSQGSASIQSTAKTRSITVIMGGWSAEREVSLVSGAAIADALESTGHDVRAHDLGGPDGERDTGALVDALSPRPDIVFNALHGRYGEDGCLQGMLDLLNIPYTHSGVLASAMAMNKPVAKRLFADAGIRCPRGMVLTREEFAGSLTIAPPYVVKPVDEGSSIGVHIVWPGDAPPDPESDWPFGDTVLVEEYIPGREIAVGIMGDAPIGVVEIEPVEGFYDYQTKYTDGMARHTIPADLAPDRLDAAQEYALRAHQTLGCRGISRADFRLNDTTDGDPGLYLLEINTQPGMTPISLVPELAAHAGIPFPALVQWMVENASCGN